MKKLLVIFFIIFVTACSDIEFIYTDKENLLNPLYEKTKVDVTGVDLSFINSYLPMFFGNTFNEDFILSINIVEKKLKRSVETNQSTTTLRYELRFFYSILSKELNCIVFEKEILSYFSIVPKSSGYNYGTDASLEKKYELAVTDNLNQFVSFLSENQIKNCQ
tara:strand:+ start:226 stop:714 length:489 start_codon:yes stop_codon:yes gene_type:complete